MPRTTVFAALTLLAISIAVVPSGAFAQEVNVSSGLTLAGSPLALRGYDPVAYFEDGRPRLGKAELSAVHGGATYRFASQKNLDLFTKAPDQYIPEFGGFCAFGVALGAKFDGDPAVWKVVDSKLYLNLNPEIQKSWLADVANAVAKAEDNWPRIRSQEPAALKPQG